MFAQMRRMLMVLLLLGGVFRAQAMDRFEALGLIETGNDDKATGPRGEVSRYQIQPLVWKRYAPATADWTNPREALEVAKAIMQERCAAFRRASNRPPADFEFYILWNAPAQIQSPSKAVSNRAERFANLVGLRLPPGGAAPSEPQRPGN